MSAPTVSTSSGGGTPESLPGQVSIAPGVRMAEAHLRWAFARSSGPGGQNVNKLETKAELRVSVDDLPVNGRVRHRLRQIAGKRIVGPETVVDEEGRERTRGGELIITSGEHRSQGRNKSECLDRLRELLVEALAEPKVRRKTKPSRSSVQRRIDEKKTRGEIKRGRGGKHD
jgi:ribosome-associated protein